MLYTKDMFKLCIPCLNHNFMFFFQEGCYIATCGYVVHKRHDDIFVKKNVSIVTVYLGKHIKHKQDTSRQFFPQQPSLRYGSIITTKVIVANSSQPKAVVHKQHK